MKILVSALGTYGDIFPMVSIALELQAIGHQVIVSTEQFMVELISSYCLRTTFHLTGIVEKTQNVTEIKPNKRTTFVMNLVSRTTEAGFENLMEINKEHRFELIVRHFFDTSSLLLAKKTSIPYINIYLTSASFFSSYDPPYTLDFPLITKFAKYKLFNNFAKKLINFMMAKTMFKQYNISAKK